MNIPPLARSAYRITLAIATAALGFTFVSAARAADAGPLVQRPAATAAAR